MGEPMVHIGKLLPFRVGDLLQDGQRVSTNEVRLDQSFSNLKVHSWRLWVLGSL